MEIRIERRARKFLDKIEKGDGKTFDRISSSIENLPNCLFQRQGDIKQIEGAKGLYRLRVGEIRIIFRPKLPDIIIIEEIEFRGNIYK